MKLEDLLECDGSTLQAMTDEQLLEHFKQYLCVTRPEQIRATREVSRPKQQPIIYISPAKKAALEMLQANGVDLSWMNNNKKRK